VFPEFVEISIGPPINPTTNVFPFADEAIEPIKLLPALFDTTLLCRNHLISGASMKG
jgi:hypothetical protein